MANRKIKILIIEVKILVFKKSTTSLYCDSTMSSALILFFFIYIYNFYCNSKEKDHIRRKLNNKRKIYGTGAELSHCESV